MPKEQARRQLALEEYNPILLYRSAAMAHGEVRNSVNRETATARGA